MFQKPRALMGCMAVVLSTFSYADSTNASTKPESVNLTIIQWPVHNDTTTANGPIMLIPHQFNFDESNSTHRIAFRPEIAASCGDGKKNECKQTVVAGVSVFSLKKVDSNHIRLQGHIVYRVGRSERSILADGENVFKEIPDNVELIEEGIRTYPFDLFLQAGQTGDIQGYMSSHIVVKYIADSPSD